MNPLVVLAIALVVVIALKPLSPAASTSLGESAPGQAGLERWRFIAVLAGVIWPYSEVILFLLGGGPYLQGRHALFWSLPLLPLYGCILAALLSPVVRQPWRELLPGVLIGMLLTVLLGMLTEDGIQPLALLSDARIGLAWLNPLDWVLPALALFGLMMVLAFPMYKRDMARLALGCMGVYLAATGVLNWQAGKLAASYAAAEAHTTPANLAVSGTHLRVEPGFGSPFNWLLLVEEKNGNLHLAHVNLAKRPVSTAEAADSRDDSLDDDKNPATDWAAPGAEDWEIFSRFDRNGATPLSPALQKKVRLAWYGWLASPYAWQARDAVFSALAPRPDSPLLQKPITHKQSGDPAILADDKNLCVRFRDVREPTASEQYLVCPGHRAGSWQRSRIFAVDGVPADSGDGAVSGSIVAPGHPHELVPIFSVS